MSLPEEPDWDSVCQGEVEHAKLGAKQWLAEYLEKQGGITPGLVGRWRPTNGELDVLTSALNLPRDDLLAWAREESR